MKNRWAARHEKSTGAMQGLENEADQAVAVLAFLLC
jgi:hypothetical protein